MRPELFFSGESGGRRNDPRVAAASPPSWIAGRGARNSSRRGVHTHASEPPASAATAAAARCHYTVLEIEDGAAADGAAIRRAFMRAALAWCVLGPGGADRLCSDSNSGVLTPPGWCRHPDRNPDPAAPRRFDAIQQAFAVLSDPVRTHLLAYLASSKGRLSAAQHSNTWR